MKTPPRRRLARAAHLCIELLEARIAPATFTVTTVADHGAGSLRQAITDANAAAGFDTIKFNIAPLGPKLINLDSALPTITDPLFINGSSQPGTPSNTPGIQIDGTGAGAANGIDVVAGDSTIEGFVISNFKKVGVFIHVKGGDVVNNCCIGVDHNGEVAAPNLLGGVQILNVSLNAVQSSVTSGNGKYGILITGEKAMNNVVQSTTIGLDRTGTKALPNQGSGVLVADGASLSRVDHSFISGNTGNGLSFLPGTSSNRVTNNMIGVDIGGTLPIPNKQDGVSIDDSSFNLIGGTTLSDGDGNIISGNGKHGVYIFSDPAGGGSASGNQVLGNYIGVNVDGNRAIANQSDGVFVFGAQDTVIGSPIITDRNVISGNIGNGILVSGSQSSHTLIQGNFIGTDRNGTRAGTSAIGNEQNGIRIFEAPDVIVGGADAGEGNVVSDNSKDGVAILGKHSSGAVLAGNRIGTDVTGKVRLGNVMNGVSITGTAGAVIGGSGAPEGNVISGNQQNGLLLSGPSTKSTMVYHNFIGTDITGKVGLANTLDGVLISDSPSNTIGGVHEGGNTISGNGGDGVQVKGAKARANHIVSNQIGTNDVGTAKLANSGDGVHVLGAPGTFIGDPDADSGNVISGNDGNGVHIEGAAAKKTLVLGNIVGLGTNGLAQMGNKLNGVLVENASATAIGSPLPNTGNVISANTLDGVLVTGANSGTVILGNLIGLDGSGMVRRGNGENGVELVGTSRVAVGAPEPNLGNVIADHVSPDFAGILVDGGGANKIQGNLIGTDETGLGGLGNAAGVVVTGGAGATQIGGLLAGEGNLVSDNGEGVVITGAGTFQNTVEGNRIGLDKSGAPLGNGTGVVLEMGAASNVIGNRARAGANVIAGNDNNGVLLLDPTTKLNTIFGNFIGTDQASTPGIGNGANGISVAGGANLNKIGGRLAGQDNVIVANGGNGVLITGAGSDRNVVEGNFIGTDRPGVAGVGNSLNGIAIAAGAQKNFIGGSRPGQGNIISANTGDGVAISGGSNGDFVFGNLIGDAKAALHNKGNGVSINASAKNSIGGIGKGQGNAIVGNDLDGVLITGAASVLNVLDSNVISSSGKNGVELAAGATKNSVFANGIGTNAAGTAPLPNATGILITGSPGNFIGGPFRGDGNLISGNTGDGIDIVGGASTRNQVLGNLIGTNGGGAAALANGGFGIAILGAPQNVIGQAGGALSANLISGNGADGIFITGAGATANVVSHNFIGTAKGGGSAIPNKGAGVSIQGSSTNLIGGPAGARNVIANNKFDGISVENLTGPADGNRIQQNAIYDNGGLGIDLGDDGVTPNEPDANDDTDTGPNGLQNFPLLSALTDGKRADVSCFLQSKPNTTYEIEVFSNPTADPSGFGEGANFLARGLLVTDSVGHGALNLTGVPARIGALLSATATDLTTKDTSEFSTSVPVGKAPPRVVDSTLVLSGDHVSKVVLTFQGGLNLGTATKTANYTLTDLGPDGAFGTSDDVAVKIASAKYNHTSNTVTLTPKVAPPAGDFLRVLASGSKITDPTGLKLNGEFDGHLPSGDGAAGGDFIVLMQRAASIAYADSNGDQVTLALTGGGTIELLRSASGEGELLRIIDAVAAVTALTGNVTPAGSGDGTTTLNGIFSPIPVTNNLPPAKFIITG